MPDKNALRILFDTFWSSAGWKRDPVASRRDFVIAHAAGVMFEHSNELHDEVVARAIAARERLDLHTVAAAFLASLSSRRQEWRSALGSFALASRLEPHAWIPHLHNPHCATCGLVQNVDTDLNVLSFERFKWGGVRHTHVVYAAFDLERFLAEGADSPKEEDYALLRGILKLAQEAPAHETATMLASRLTKAKLPAGSKQERETVIDLLGMIGVLSVPEQPSFLDQFTPWSGRSIPNKHFVEREWPVCWWKGSNGVDRKRASEVFGERL